MLNPDPTPEGQDGAFGAAGKAAGLLAGPGGSRALTYAERKKANKEQEKLEQQREKNIATKQDRARKQFISELHDKRRLESLKAQARVQRNPSDNTAGCILYLEDQRSRFRNNL